MRTATLLATTVLIALASGAAQASEWVSIGNRRDKDVDATVSVNVTGIRTDGDVRRAWFKVVYAHPRPGAVDRMLSPYPAPKPVASRLVHYAFICARGKFRLEEVDVHYVDGTALASASPRPLKWSAARPDTDIDEMMLFVCAWKPK